MFFSITGKFNMKSQVYMQYVSFKIPQRMFSRQFTTSMLNMLQTSIYVTYWCGHWILRIVNGCKS